MGTATAWAGLDHPDAATHAADATSLAGWHGKQACLGGSVLSENLGLGGLPVGNTVGRSQPRAAVGLPGASPSLPAARSSAARAGAAAGGAAFRTRPRAWFREALHGMVSGMGAGRPGPRMCGGRMWGGGWLGVARAVMCGQRWGLGCASHPTAALRRHIPRRPEVPQGACLLVGLPPNVATVGWGWGGVGWGWVSCFGRVCLELLGGGGC